MTDDRQPESNTRGLLRSITVIASAQFLSIFIRILKAKLVAVLLGPTGAGLLSVFANLQMLISQVAGLGLPQSGVRDLASSRHDPNLLGQIKQVLTVMLALQGGVGMVVVWHMRTQISNILLGNAEHATEIGLVGIAALIFLLASSQQTLLRGARRIGDLGRVMVLGTLAGATAGIAAILMMGKDGLIWFLLAEPIGALVVGVIYVRRIPLNTDRRPTPKEFGQRWSKMIRLGIAFMLGGIVQTVTLIIVRTLIVRDLSLAEAGQFAAAWTITFTYIGFLVQAMLNDYFPRLVEVIEDRDQAVKLINDQLQLAFALGAPILLLMIGIAPWAMRALYSNEFDTASTILQWQMAGSVLMLASRSLGAAFIAAGRSLVFLYTQVQFHLIFLAIIWLGLPTMGVEITGIAFLIAHLIHLFTSSFLANKLHKFHWQPRSVWLLSVQSLLAFSLLAFVRMLPLAGALIAIILSVATLIISTHHILTKIGSNGRLTSRIIKIFEVLGWPVKVEVENVPR